MVVLEPSILLLVSSFLVVWSSGCSYIFLNGGNRGDGVKHFCSASFIQIPNVFGILVEKNSQGDQKQILVLVLLYVWMSLFLEVCFQYLDGVYCWSCRVEPLIPPVTPLRNCLKSPLLNCKVLGVWGHRCRTPAWPLSGHSLVLLILFCGCNSVSQSRFPGIPLLSFLTEEWLWSGNILETDMPFYKNLFCIFWHSVLKHIRLWSSFVLGTVGVGVYCFWICRATKSMVVLPSSRSHSAQTYLLHSINLGREEQWHHALLIILSVCLFKTL